MTLIVVRKIDDEVRIVSDTKLTDGLALHRTLLDGGLKSIVVSPTCCVCFAGNVVLAKEALSPILNGTVRSREEIVTHLFQRHKAFKGKADFLLACVGERVAIDRITQGELETDLISTWIGDQPAFEAYQTQYHSESFQSAPLVSSDNCSRISSLMNNAFRAVIEDHRQASVGDFAIEVTSKPVSKGGFRYLCKAGGFGFHPVSNTTTPTSLLRSLGVEGGSFHYTILVPAVAGVGAVAVYLLEGKVGVFFYPAKFWSPTVFKNVRIEEFLQVIEQRFDVRVDGFRLC